MVRDMTHGSPLKLIFGFWLPLLLGNLFQQVYNVADSVIVGRFVGVKAFAGVSATEEKPVGWMCDAGTESSQAVRYDREGKAEAILLGMTGDDLLENTDPNAQALYLKLRLLFPFVRCYAGEETQGWGFRPISIAAFCHLDEINWDDVRVSAWYTDCEAGPQQRDLTEDEEKRILDCVKTGFVIGKENAFGVTGGTTTFFFSDRDGKTLGSIELYNGLLVCNDGMYHLTPFSF